ncbi:hypothetical protein [Mycoplasma struthionis]|uniref:IgG-blocking virulence domain-containing protein n=1 Tax=Mycoplasma struthionis TaxID=538220 RepID=A0A502M937_9MOLU|nr:hypothetical protein [Mycoplasma struthionis]TPI02272.1 hypothetical protein FJM01_01225 [Mycoplasma struthionis]
MAVYSKKRKVIKALVSVGAIGMVSAGVAAGIYTTRSKIGFNVKLDAFERNSTPKLNTDDVIIKDANNSNTDVNLVRKPDPEKDVITKLLFKDSKTGELKFKAQVISKKDEDKKIDPTTYIASGWEIDVKKQGAEKPTVNLGQENEYWIKEEDPSENTVIQIIFNDEVYRSDSFKKGTRSLENLASYLPDGFEYVDPNYKIIEGKTNRFLIKKVKVVTVLNFINEQGHTVYRTTITRDKGDNTPIDWKFEIPTGFKTKENPDTIKIKPDEENNIVVVPISKLPERPQDDPTPPKTLDEDRREDNRREVNAPASQPQITPADIPKPRSNAPEDQPATATPGVDVYPDTYVKDYNETSITPTNPQPLSGAAREEVRAEVNKYDKILEINSEADFKRLKSDLINTFKPGDEVIFDRFFENAVFGQPGGLATLKRLINDIKENWESFANKGMVPVIWFWQHYPTYNNGGTVWDFYNKKDNAVLNHYIKENESRYFSSSSEYKRNPGQVLDNDYFGWTKEDASDKFPGLTKKSW